MTPIQQLEAAGDTQKAVEMAAYHKATRTVYGVSNPQIDTLVKQWRAERDVEERVELARTLWDSNVLEARISAAKLLVQARLRPSDSSAWALIASWVPKFDSWAIADHASTAGAKRLVADPARLDEVEAWTTSEHMWSRRAALVMTLPWAKLNNLSDDQRAARERILGWAAGYVKDPEWFIQKAIAWWIRDLSKHDAARARTFLADHGDEMKPFALKIAAKYLS